MLDDATQNGSLMGEFHLCNIGAKFFEDTPTSK